jgi:lipoate-protein ligase A
MIDSNWRFLISEETDPFQNMAIEEALLSAVEQGFSPNTVRFWKNKPSVIIGSFEKPYEVLNISSCLQYDIIPVRRFTGGGAVYNDLGNLNWTVICRKDSRLLDKINNISGFYEKILNLIVLSIKELGIESEIRYINNIFTSEGKISGTAMYVKKNTVLCHGTLLINSNLDILRTVLKELKYPVINISKINNISDESIINEIIVSIKKLHNIKLIYSELTEVEKKLVEEICLKKYII